MNILIPTFVFKNNDCCVCESDSKKFGTGEVEVVVGVDDRVLIFYYTIAIVL